MSDITRSEAIKTLKEHLSHWERLLQEHICEEQEGIDTISALKLAIASLETDEAYQLEYKSTTKNDLVTLTFSKGTLKYSCKDYVVYKKDWLRSHYGAEIDIMFGDSQYNEPTTKNDLGVNVHDNNVGNIDCISRADAIGSIAVECSAEKLDIDYAKFLMLRRAIKALPTVTPIRPKGHWICDGKGRSFADYHCSECGLKLALCGQDIKQRQDSGYSLFCGGCGADMREVVEE